MCYTFRMYGTNPLLLANLLDPGMILFGVLLVFFGAAILCIFLLKSIPDIAYPLAAIIAVLLVALVGHTILNLFLPTVHAAPESLTAAMMLFLAHRWMMLALAKILLALSLVLLLVYGPRIAQPHARTYYGIVIFSVILSFIALLVSVFESSL